MTHNTYRTKSADRSVDDAWSERRNPNEARQASVLTWDEARRIAANIAKLPELLGAKD